MAAEVDTELVAYMTIDGVVHGCVWKDWPGHSETVLICTNKRVHWDTRTSANYETITCITCTVIGWT